jgi:putative component of membrane protein insertase Oxa1/YidC/SpoIIIJ protein YidD
MKVLLLLVIEFYWALVPKSKRRKCLFKISCSQYVHQQTKESFHEGVIAFRYRFQNCRTGYQIFEDPIERCKMMILPNGQIISEDKIAERLIKYSTKDTPNS